MKVKSESEVAQLCPTLRDPIDCSPPGFSIHGIFQARVLEWGAIAFSDLVIIWFIYGCTMWHVGFFVAAHQLVVAHGLSICSMKDSRMRRLQQLWHMNLAALHHVGVELSSWTREWTPVSCISRWILFFNFNWKKIALQCARWVLNHGTTREVSGRVNF